MSALQEEQTFFRLQLLGPGKPVPFSIIPPLCPCPEIPDHFTPEVGALLVDSGWILHPCDCVRNHQALSPVQALSPDNFTLPGYPLLPRTAGFILGYAGNEADKLVTMDCPGTKKLPKIPFPAKFWYRANVTIEYTSNQETGAIITRWTIGEKIRESRGH
ncbi:MAG TPA: hypothetical protein PLS27_03085 [Treponemataceae bacterium]|nr:hypothetical protein [Treponemataceae bacterium]HQB87560.1 hypothetical protein [Treponemataceae bacterium]